MQITKNKINWLGILCLFLGCFLSFFYFPFLIIGLFIYGALSLQTGTIIWIGEQKDKLVVRTLSTIVILFAIYLLINHLKII